VFSPASGDGVSKFYRPRNPSATLFYQLASGHLNDLIQAYPARYQKYYGFWRPAIGASLKKYLKCGDLKEGFARVRCPECGEEMFVSFSCKQRGACPSCDQKRALLLGLRLADEILESVPHRQWVFTIPKCLRTYFRLNRKLLGPLCRMAYETVKEALARSIGDDFLVPGMVASIQTFGDLIHWNSHIHALVSEGGFTENGRFVKMPEIDRFLCLGLWQSKVYRLLREQVPASRPVIQTIRTWKHSGFSIDNKVRIEAGDREAIRRLAEYIARCPFSLTRMSTLNEQGQVVYKAIKAEPQAYPIMGNLFQAGPRRTSQVYDPLDFLAEVTQHIPNKGEHQIRYSGWYSKKSRGMRAKKAAAESNGGIVDKPRKCSLAWAALIRLVYEVDPLKCPKCGSTMKVIAFIKKEDVIENMLKKSGLWYDSPVRPPPPVSLAA